MSVPLNSSQYLMITFGSTGLGLTSLLMWDDRSYPAVWVNIHYVNASSRSSWLRLSLCPVTEAADASKSRGIVFLFFLQGGNVINS